MEEHKTETVKLLLETYNDGILKGMEIAQDSLIEFLRIKEEKHKLAPTASISELALFMKTTIDLYKESYNKK